MIKALDGVHWIADAPTNLRVCVCVDGGPSVDDDDDDNGNMRTWASSLVDVVVNNKRGASPFIQQKKKKKGKHYYSVSPLTRTTAGEPILFCDNGGALVPVPDHENRSLTVLLVDDANATTRVLAEATFDDWFDDDLPQESTPSSSSRRVKLAPLKRPGESDEAVAAVLKVEVTFLPSESSSEKNREEDAEEVDDFRGLVEDVVLLGAPLRGPSWSNDEATRWRDCAALVAGDFVNAYSRHDLMLALCYRSQSWATNITGLHPVNLPGLVRDVDVSHVVKSHDDYPRRIDTLLFDTCHFASSRRRGSVVCREGGPGGAKVKRRNNNNGDDPPPTTGSSSS